jgi:hypothetical protein
MSEYRHKKTNFFRAFQFDVDTFPDWFGKELAGTKMYPDSTNPNLYEMGGKGVLLLTGKDGKKYCSIEKTADNCSHSVIESGDYIIQLSNGDLLPMQKEQFEQRYEKIN